VGAKAVGNLIQGDLARCLREAGVTGVQSLPASLAPERLVELLLMLKEGRLSRGLVRPSLLTSALRYPLV
jgi:Asp-tRNA(Asn)/Glu-tRNA(Gln) amidotransferase B subunit